VANAGLGRSDVLAFWFGESDEVTPEVREAAAEVAADGETFYSHNLGLPELRAGAGGLHLRPAWPDRRRPHRRHLVGRQRADAGDADAGRPGDEVVAVVPVWPNLTAQPAILGAR
jgi:aspartate/methionine/tyrosine aminotransferase